MNLWAKAFCDRPAAPTLSGASDVVGRNSRLVVRVVLLQAACALIMGALFWIVRGSAAASSGLAGGLVVAVGSALFGWRLFLPGIAPATTLRRALFAAESLKWLWYVLAVWGAIARVKLPPLPFMAGLMFGQFGYWLGLLGKRG